MKLYESLEKQLKKEPNYVTDNGEVKKWVVINKAQNYDAELIGLLLDDKELKAKFFLDIKGVLVFNQSLFVQFLEQKNYLNDSYTAYKNKVGLNIDGKYLKQRNEVALVWPFKDCVLEGGQSRDEDSREEIFFNETLAQDEITQLLEPKVLASTKRYTAKGDKPLDKFNRNEEGTITDNIILKGNNLLALHSLKAEFAGKVKLIYIDPPYNTDNDSFSYNDSFTHSAWLTFMQNRLEIAKELLSDDGLIFVQMDSTRNSQIGTSELPYLNILLDDIFGRINFIGNLHWKKKKQPSFLSRIAGIMECILIYAKNESKVGKLSIETISDSNKPIVNASNGTSEILFKKGMRVKKEIELITKGVYTTRSMDIEYLDDVKVKDGRTTSDVKIKAKFRTSQKNIDEFLKQDLIFITSNLGLRRDVTEEEKGKSKAITDLLLDWGQNQDADDEIKKLFNTNTKKDYPQIRQKNLSKWQRFVKFYKGQLKELSDAYQPDLYWFDGDWEKSSEQWQAQSLKDSLLAWNPKTIVNSRLKTYGDYSTPEQGIPVVRPTGAWEFCMTMNDSWGYYPTDTNYKPISQIIRTFVEVIASGGNLLLNIGPKPDGTIAKEQEERLEALGEWVNKHEKVVFGTKAGLPYGHFYGPTLLSKDETKIYLCLFDAPKNYISLKGIQNKVKSIKVVGSNQKLNFERNGGAAWNNIPGILRIEIPQEKNIDSYVTIVEIELEDGLKLYRGHGNAVELN